MATAVTKVVVQGQAQGFQQAQTVVTKFTGAMQQGLAKIPAKKFKQEMKELEKQLQDTAKKQLALNNAMKGMADGSAQLKKAAADMKVLDKEAGNAQRSIQMLINAFGRKNAARAQASEGAFTQGLLGGLLGPMGSMIQRGPGAFAQAAGGFIGGIPRMMGRGAMGAANWGSNALVNGQGAVTGVLGAIPGVGGAMAAAASQAFGMAQEAKQNIARKQEVLPFTSGLYRAGLSQREREDRALRESKFADRAFGQDTIWNMQELDGGKVVKRFQKRSAGQNSTEALNQATDAYNKAKARIDRSSGPRDLAMRLGMDFGYSGIDAREQLSSAIRRGGGTGADLSETDIGAMFGAKRAFGVDLGTSGAFLRGNRMGAFSGISGSTGDVLAQSIASARGAGLEGQDVIDYLETIAAGIDSFKNTGIPINPTSLGELGKEISDMGINNERGVSVAKNLDEYAKGMSGRGPQTGLDFLFAQKVYGYNGGGGAQATWDFMKRSGMGMGGMNGEGIQKFIEALVTRSGDIKDPGDRKAMNLMNMKSAFDKAGINFGHGELEDMYDLTLAKRGEGPYTDDMNQRFAKIMNSKGIRLGAKDAAAIDDADKLAARGRSSTSGVLKGEAAMANQRDAVGQKLIPASMAFERASQNMAQAVTKVFAPSIDKFGKIVDRAAKWAANEGSDKLMSIMPGMD